MSVDILLTCITLIVAIVGTLLEKPSRRVKGFLIGLAVVASLASAIKAVSDEEDKRFMKLALVSTLTPSNAAYKNLIADVDDQARKDGLDNYDCHHQSSGMACSLSSSKDQSKHATLVLNSSEMSQMYANEIGKKSNAEAIRQACAQVYDPSRLDEDFKDKVGILGSSLYASLFGRWPEYNYDDAIGVKIVFEENGVTKEIGFTPDELTAMKADKACELFSKIEHGFRLKYADLSEPHKN